MMFHVKRSAAPIAPLPVSRETHARLELFAELLLRWNKTVNLISAGDVQEIWPRHINDALQLDPLIASGTSRAIDLGSGAGLPGLVLAIATNIHFDLIEADQRKAAFLREAARLTDAPATVHPTRIERADVTPAMLVCARALAPLPQLISLAAPLLAPGGVCLFPKGAGADREIEAAEAAWSMRLERFPSRTNPDATILRIRDIIAR